MDNTENIEEIKKLFKERGMAYKGDLIESLSEEEFRAGCIKFYIPPEDDDACGESIWGWTTPEDKEKYNDDDFYGEIKAILTNQPLNYCGALAWGCEVILKCNGADRPDLSNDFIRNILQPIIDKERSEENE